MAKATTTTQQGEAACRWCQGTGRVLTAEKGNVKCPKCGGSGKAPKTTTKG